MIRKTMTCLAFVAALLTAPSAHAQTPEQRYTDWASSTFPAAEYEGRRAAALELLAEVGGGILLIPSSDGVTHGDTFRQLDDFLYFTGLELPASMLALDSDADGVCDGLDNCPDTMRGCWVDENGCSRDSDDDGVCDGIDQCPDTQDGCRVNGKGCPRYRPSGERVD